MRQMKRGLGVMLVPLVGGGPCISSALTGRAAMHHSARPQSDLVRMFFIGSSSFSYVIIGKEPIVMAAAEALASDVPVALRWV